MSHINVDDAGFSSLIANTQNAVLVDFWAEWCGPCKRIAPFVEELAKEYAGKLTVAKMDIDENPETPAQFGIRSIPTLLVFKNGQKVAEIIGAVPKQAILERVTPYL